MTSRGEATTETGQEHGDPPWTVFHTGTSLTETLRRTISAERAIYLLPIVLFFFSLFFGRYMMDPVETLRILVIGSANIFLDWTSSLLSTLSGHEVLLPSFEQTWGASEQTVIFRIRLHGL